MTPLSNGSDQPKYNLASKAARGAVVTLTGQVGRILVQLLSTIVLARMLMPADFGLVAIAAAFIGVGEVVRDFGLSSAAIQARTLSREQRDTLVWLNVILGVSLSLAFFFAAPVIADAFGNPSLTPIMQWLSLVVLFGGAGTQFRASLTRNMQFGRLAACDLAAPVLGLALAIVAASAGMNAYALVVQQVVTAGTAFLGVAIVGRWLPGPPRRNTNLRPLLIYGGHLFLSQLFDYASKNVDTIVIGARFTPTDVGIYDRAFKFLMVPLMQLNAPFTRVALPTLSQLQDNPAKFEIYLLRAQKLVAYFLIAVLVICASQAVPLVNLLLGPRWIASAPILQVLAIGGIFHVVWYATMWVFLAKALTKSYMRFTFVARLTSIAFVILGSFWGPVGVAVGYSAGFALQWPLGIWWVRKIPGVSPIAMIRNGSRIILILTLAALPGLVISSFWRPAPDIVNLTLGTGCLLLVLACAAFTVPSFRADYRELVDSIGRARAKGITTS